MFVAAEFSKIWNAIMAHPEATMTIFVSGLFLGWGASWLLAHRELKVNRAIIAGLKEPTTSEHTKQELLGNALPQRGRGPWVKSFAVVILMSIVAAAVTLAIQSSQKQPRWEITARQEEDLKIALAFLPTKISFPISVVAGAPGDAVDLGYRLMHLVSASPGWSAGLNVIDAEFSPRLTGLNIATKVGTDPEKNEKARVLKTIFERAGFKLAYTGDHQLPDGQAKLVIGKHP